MRLSIPSRIILAVVVALCLLPIQSQVASAAITNDYYINNQTHLKQIRADRAWSVVTGNRAITIAVLDSGVDTDHPDLKNNLLPGINLVNPGRTAEDDNGHGTMVAGILAAQGNNGIGVSGVLWDAKILPIKVLDHKGEAGSADILAKGIRTAIDHKAKIIVMSVSNLNPSKALEDAVRYAESKGVLLVAASGNESSRVAYPAAYPTVIAVGAVNEQNTPIYQSNNGNELDIMAPGWGVYTTKVGGKYGSMKGTSAAAPQVAAAAAMILAKNPYYSPLDVRQVLYYSAINLGAKGWDAKTGYGLLNVDTAVHTSTPPDFLETNNTKALAKAFPIESQIRAVINARDSVDWYYMDIAYEGRVTFDTQVSTGSAAPLAATFYRENDVPVTYYLGNSGTTTISVKPGRYYIKMMRSGGMGDFSYTVTSKFMVSADRYETNDDQKQARPLPLGNRVSVTGNFHKPNDLDWFSYYVRENGKMNITVSVDNLRADPVVYVTKGNQGIGKFDYGERTNPTERVNLDVSPGKYFIRVNDYYGNAVAGQYKLDVAYTPERQDTNEPNDNYRQATRLGNSALLTGTIPSRSDSDWFQFQVPSESYITITAPWVPVRSGVQFSLYNDQNFNYALFIENEVAELSAQKKPIGKMKLQRGTYYIRLTSAADFKYDTYRITVTRETLYNGYRDISSHWARSDISYLSRLGIVKGFDDYAFRPNQPITRAQFASMLIRSVNQKGTYPSRAATNPFVDLKRTHWSYDAMSKAYKLGILQGYPNKRIMPDQYITRAEMAVMVTRARNIYTYKHTYSSFDDVSANHWASPAIEALYTRRWIQGYEDSRYRPQGFASRAEIVVLLRKAFSL